MPCVSTAVKLGFVEDGIVLDKVGEDRHTCYTLPGMKRFEEGTRIGFCGEE